MTAPTSQGSSDATPASSSTVPNPASAAPMTSARETTLKLWSTVTWPGTITVAIGEISAAVVRSWSSASGRLWS